MSTLLNTLTQALRQLPGIGPKNAQRMAYRLLLHKRHHAQKLAQALTDALAGVGQCASCRDLSETTICALCANDQRDASVLCVVESPLDILAFEQTASYNGLYFVLHGQLSPLDGLGPKELGLPLFAQRLSEGMIKEVIIATSPTMEGEATAYYLQQLTDAAGIQSTRLAQGVPLGGSLELLDGATLAQALVNRR
jgi:recombination protein RecR